MIMKACRLALRKFFWIPVVGIAQGLVMFIARHGAGDFAGMAQVSLLCCAFSVAVLALVPVPLEYHRLKREAAGFPVTPQ